MAQPADIAAENRRSAGAFASAPAGDGVEVGRRARRPLAIFRGPWWFVPMLAGLATVAACVLLPLRDQNARLAHQLAATKQESAFVDDQIAANARFIEQIQTDPALLDRVRMRMTHRPIAGTKFLDGGEARATNASPFALTQIPAPPPLPEYRSDLPLPIALLFLPLKPRFVMLAGGAMLLMSALVLGGEKRRAVAAA